EPESPRVGILHAPMLVHPLPNHGGRPREELPQRRRSRLSDLAFHRFGRHPSPPALLHECGDRRKRWEHSQPPSPDLAAAIPRLPRANTSAADVSERFGLQGSLHSPRSQYAPLSREEFRFVGRGADFLDPPLACTVTRVSGCDETPAVVDAPAI